MITIFSIQKHKGLSLIELLVAMAIGLFLVGGVVSVMVNSKSQFLLEQELAFIQENARYALDEMGYDVRMAGYYGCDSTAPVTNIINEQSLGVLYWYLSSRPVFGYSSGTATAVLPVEFAADVMAAGANINSDVLIINRGVPEDSVFITSHSSSSLTGWFDIQTPAEEFFAGDILAVASSSCDQVAIFQMSTASALPTDVSPRIGYIGAVAGLAPGNCDNNLSGYSNCTSTVGATSYTFDDGSQLMRFGSYAYYIGVSPTTNQPTLFREVLQRLGPTAVTVAEEVVSGVEDMQVTYGVDTDALVTPDGIADRFYAAANIVAEEANVPGGILVAWDRVVSIRIDLILRSSRPVYSVNTQVDLNFDSDKDGIITAADIYNDRFMRQRVTSTINIRNRGLGS